MTSSPDTTAGVSQNDLAVADGLSIHVCTTCRRARPDLPDGFDKPGAALADMLARRLGQEAPGIRVLPVECLSVCKRPCTVALSGPGRWTYIYGDLDPDTGVETLITFARQYRDTADGIVPWRERAEAIRKGVVARIPPIPNGRQP